jgi:hypothetical protein
MVLGSVLNDGDEVLTVEDVGDGDEGMGMGQIRDELELGIAELGDGAVEFSQVIGSPMGLSDDNHRAKVVRHEGHETGHKA